MFAAYRRFAAGPLGMVTAVIGLMTASILGYRWYLAPAMKRKRRDQNEEYANFVFEERQKKLKENTQ